MTRNRKLLFQARVQRIDILKKMIWRMCRTQLIGKDFLCFDRHIDVKMFIQYESQSDNSPPQTSLEIMNLSADLRLSFELLFISCLKT